MLPKKTRHEIIGFRNDKSRPACPAQVGLTVGSVGLSAAILLSSVQTAHAVTPEQLLFLEVSLLWCLWQTWQDMVGFTTEELWLLGYHISKSQVQIKLRCAGMEGSR